MSWADEADGVIGAAMEAFGDAHEVAFAAPVAVKSTYGSGRGVFDAAHELVEMGGDAAITTIGPVLSIRLADFDVAPQQDNEVTIDGTLYRIYDVQPDGQAGAKLLLKARKL